LTKGRRLEVNLLTTLNNILKSYTETDHMDVLVNEVIANGLDAFQDHSIKNGVISIKIARTDSEYGYIEFHNNAPPMTKTQFFEKYHTLSESSKTAGDGIGYAGVGAKLFAGSVMGGQIITITGKDGNDFFASRMYEEDSDILRKTSDQDPLNEILDVSNYTHQYGTTYKARLSLAAYKQLKEKLPKIIQKWWNYALITKKFSVIIDDVELKPWIPRGDKKFRKTFTWKKNKITALCFIADETIPEERRHIVMTVHGKRIENLTLENPMRIKDDYSNRVFCIVDTSVLGQYLGLNKESFDRNWQTNDCRNKMKTAFWDFLEKEGLIKSSKSEISTSTIVNELTKRLDDLLGQKQFQHLNPFLNTKQRLIPVRDSDGNIPVSEVDGDSLGDGKGKGKEKSGRDVGDGISNVSDEDGNDAGSMKERKSKGLEIIPAFDIVDHQREAFVSPELRGIVIDMTHPFFEKCSNNPTLHNFNLSRILVEALIIHKQKEHTWNTEQTFTEFRKLFHSAWI
jgi:hypothetical protein